jgi:hypothetical protein
MLVAAEVQAVGLNLGWIDMREHVVIVRILFLPISGYIYSHD